tara:strand:- start:2896 stop:3282 length:387 start_codon:yes stop_codon:yes gene_type:complete
MAFTFMTGETVCKKCHSEMPVDSSECRSLIVKLKKELDKERVRKEASYKQEKILQREVDELRKQRFRYYNDEEYIIFMDDGEDYPESMVCPVVMSADQFRELYSARETMRKLAADPVFQTITKLTNNF